VSAGIDLREESNAVSCLLMSTLKKIWAVSDSKFWLLAFIDMADINITDEMLIARIVILLASKTARSVLRVA